jgi:hypothetical protein
MKIYKIIEILRNSAGGITENQRLDVDSTAATPTFSAVTVANDLVVSGAISGNTFSGGTFYGDGSNLSGVSGDNDFTTGTTIIGNTVFYDRTNALSAYTSDLSQLDNLPTDEQFQLFGNQSSTGIIYTDGLSINADNTKFDLGLTQGWVIDNTTDPLNPTITFINFSATTGITPTFLTGSPITYIGLSGSTAGDIVQQISPFSPDEHRDILELGAVIHSDNTIINVVNNLPTIGIDPTSQLYDLIYSLGYFNLDLAGIQGNIYR